MAEQTVSDKPSPLLKKSRKPSAPRLSSLDAYRGFTMILLAASGFGLAAAANKFPESTTWQTVGYLFSHVHWGFLPDINNKWDFAHWITIWDMIQPSFMFMVGVSMPFSYLSRKKKGDSYLRMFFHALWRAVVLVLLGIFLRSLNTKTTNWFFMDVVAQIGLGYLFLFLLWNRGFKIQLAALVVILVGYWAWFAFTPLPDKDFDYASVGRVVLPENYAPEKATQAEKKKYAVALLQYNGFQAHWNKNTNPAHTFDVWFMNLFPQNHPKKGYVKVSQKEGEEQGKKQKKPVYKFAYSSGGYQVLNFIPSLATMLLGLMAGTLLQDNKKRTGRKLLLLLGGGLLCIALGKGLDMAGVCPIVKRIWTPTWTLFSGGLCLWLLLGFYLVMDVIRFRFWAFPAVVVGMNSIAIYVMGATMKAPVSRFLKRHFGADIYTLYGRVAVEVQPVVELSLVFIVFWLILYWMYRNKFFIRI